MDNIKIDLRLETKYLKEVLSLIIKIRNQVPVSYVIHEKYGLILFSAHQEEKHLFYDEKNVKCEKLPPIRVEDFVESWLKDAKPQDFITDDYEDEAYPSSDVMNEVGFRLYVEEWGNVAGCFDAIVAIKPICCWYGK